MCLVKLCFFRPFFSIDVPHAQFGRWGVWDSTNHPSTRDGARPGVIGGALSLPGGPGASSSTPGSLNPSVPPTEPRAALHYHLTQHDGPGWDCWQQWPTCGECYIVHKLSHVCHYGVTVTGLSVASIVSAASGLADNTGGICSHWVNVMILCN